MADMSRGIVRGVLLCFVLISIGFALGKEVTNRRVAATSASTSAPQSAEAEMRIAVYYMHMTIRCVSCNRIEQMAHDLVETEFADALSDGRVEWESVNIDENPGQASAYEVASSTVVVVLFRDGKVSRFTRLDDVWTLYEQPDEFSDYVGGTIREYLEGAGR